MLEFGVGINDLHRSAAQHERRPHEHGIAEFLGDCHRFSFVGGNAIGGLGDVQPVQHRGEELAVFGHFNALRRGADDIDAVVLQTEGEIERCLAAELHDRAPACFPFVNVQHVFERERFEIEAITGVVIRGYGFRIAVDHDRLIAVVAKSERCVTAAVIKLNSLPDAIGSAAQDDDFFLLSRRRLVFIFVS